MLDPEELEAALQSANKQLPAHVQVIRFSKLATPTANIYGGLPLTTGTGPNNCTSGFSVQDQYGIKGIATAGHCTEEIYYNGIWLPWMGGTSGGTYDTQWNRVDYPHVAKNLIYDGYGNRSITSAVFQPSQPIGATVCKYGIATGYGCGQIYDNNWEGANIRVTGIVVQGGDSGGPWFRRNEAWGTTIANFIEGCCTQGAIYRPPDNMWDVMRVSVLTQ